MARFMIVDDSLFQRKNLEKMVVLMGGEVVAQASDGKEAVELYPHFHPDIVLMDLLMPGMEGIDALKRILEVDKEAKIIVISSMGYGEVVAQAISSGAKEFITKPVDIDHATDVIRSIMNV